MKLTNAQMDELSSYFNGEDLGALARLRGLSTELEVDLNRAGQLMETVQEHVQTVAQSVEAFREGAEDQLEEAVEHCSAVPEVLSKEIEEIVLGAVTLLEEFLDGLTEKVLDAAKGAVEDAFDKVLQELREKVLEPSRQAVSEFRDDALAGARELLDAALADLLACVTDFAEKLDEKLSDSRGSRELGEALTAELEALKAPIEEAMDRVLGLADSLGVSLR